MNLDESQEGFYRSHYGIEGAPLHCRSTVHGNPAAGAGLLFGRAGQSFHTNEIVRLAQ